MDSLGNMKSIMDSFMSWYSNDNEERNESPESNESGEQCLTDSRRERLDEIQEEPSAEQNGYKVVWVPNTGSSAVNRGSYSCRKVAVMVASTATWLFLALKYSKKRPLAQRRKFPFFHDAIDFTWIHDSQSLMPFIQLHILWFLAASHLIIKSICLQSLFWDMKYIFSV